MALILAQKGVGQTPRLEITTKHLATLLGVTPGVPNEILGMCHAEQLLEEIGRRNPAQQQYFRALCWYKKTPLQERAEPSYADQNLNSLRRSDCSTGL